MKQYIPTRHGFILRTDRLWNGEYYSATARPTERMVLNHIVNKTPYPFDDDLYRARRYDLDFNDLDWKIYLLLMHLKGRVKFGTDDKSLQDEHETMKMLSESYYLNIPVTQLIVHYAEMLTKMARRGIAGLEAVPDIPKSERAKLNAMLKRVG